MGYEIEFLSVGSGEKSGDAILIRWLQDGKYRVGVVDGGTKESGESLVQHIIEHYGTSQEIEFVLNSHPDCDHCSGLTVVLEKLNVQSLWMHAPWNYSSELHQLIDDERVTEGSLEKRLKEKLAMAYSVELLAKKKNIPIFEPFQGKQVGPFTVLSPSLEWYKELVCEFRDMPASRTFDSSFLQKAFAAVRFVAESFDIETLKENGTTSAENDSSVILYADLHETRMLLTGDAGIRAMTHAADYADIVFPSWNKPLDFIQIPHHGSRRNVSPSILDRILGTKLSAGDSKRGTAYVSASKASTKHPRKSVLNAFIRRGYSCYRTNGQTIRFKKNMPDRQGWTTLSSIAFSSEVEDYD